MRPVSLEPKYTKAKGMPSRGVRRSGPCAGGAGPRVVGFHRVVEPDSRARHVTQVSGRGEGAHLPLTIGVVSMLAFGVLHAVFVRGREDDPVLGELGHAEALVVVLRLHAGAVVQLAVITELILPRLLQIMEVHDEQEVRQRKGERPQSVQRRKEHDRKIHDLTHVVDVSAGPGLVVVGRALDLLEERPVVVEQSTAGRTVGLIDQVDELFDGELGTRLRGSIGHVQGFPSWNVH